MPPVIIAAAAWAVGVITTAQLVLAVVAAAYSYDRARSARKKAKAAYNASLRDRVINLSTVDQLRARVYGRVRVADGIIFKGSHGDKKQYLTLVVALAGHEIDAVEAVYFNDQLVSFDGSGYVTTPPWNGQQVSTGGTTMPPGAGSVALPSNVIPGSVHVVLPGDPADRDPDAIVPHYLDGGLVYTDGAANSFSRRVAYQTSSEASKARVRAFLGGPSQDLSSVLSASFPGLITSNHKFKGIACLVVDLEYSQDAYPTGVPQISAVVRGAKVLDPRTGTTGWSENPALIARDWALHPNGGGAVADDLDAASFIAAANACDVVQSFTTVNAAGSSSSQSLPTYTAGLVARSDDPDGSLADIVNAMAGRWAWAGGRLRVRAGSYSAPVAEITEDWVSDQGDIDLVSTLPRTELVNVVVPTIANAAQAYVAGPIPRIEAPEYIAADGGEYPLELELAAVTDVAHAAHVAGVMLRQGRQALTVTLTCNNRALPLELFDTVSLTLPRFGWSAKPFEVLGWRFSETGGIRLTLRETDPSIYTLGAAFTRSDPAPNTALPGPYVVPAISIAAMASGNAELLRQLDGTVLTRLRVSWAAVQDEAVREGGAIELRYGPVTAPVASWHTLSVPGTETEVLLGGVQDGAAYAVSIRARNKLVAGAWSELRVHVVQGKTAPPSLPVGLAGVPVPGGLRISWAPCPDADYAETELGRFIGEVAPGWTWEGNVEPIFRGTANAFVWAPATDGPHLVMVRHIDTSGNAGPQAELLLEYTVGDATQTPALDFSRPLVLLVADAAGTVASFDGAATTVRVRSGGVDVSEDWEITRTDGADVTSTLVDGVLSITALDADEAVVTVTATREDFADLVRELPVVKIKAGAAGPGGGDFTDFRFTRSSTAPPTPTGPEPAGWFDGPPGGSEPLYMVRARKNAEGELLGAWSAPARLDGDAGAAGANAQVEYSVNGVSGWHPTFTTGDLFMRVRVGTGSWSAAIRIVGETGAAGTPATAYWMTGSAASVAKSQAGAYTPATLTFSGYSQTGSAAPAAYAGRYVIAVTADGVTWSPLYTSTVNELGTTVSVPAGIKALRVRFYLAGGITSLLDEEIIPIVLDGPPGSTGPAGINTARVLIYRRSNAGVPALPSASTTYTFASGALTGLNNGWSLTVPGGSDPLYVSAATASDPGPTDTIAPAEWAAATLLVQNGSDGSPGSDGINTATVYLYQRTGSSSAPALPSSSLTYTFANGALTGTLGAWSTTVPASGGAYLHVTTATALGTGATDTIAPGEWAAVRLLAQDGAPGANGRSLLLSASSQIFRVDQAGVAAPSSITFTATGIGLAGSAAFAVTAGSATLTGSGTSRSLSYAGLTSETATIQVTWDGLVDTITVAKVREGSDGYVALLTNEAALVQADAAGTVASFAGAGGTMMVYRGATRLTSGVTYGRTTQSGVFVNIDSSTGVYAPSSMSEASGTATLVAAIAGGPTLEKTYSIAKVLPGLAGQRGSVEASRAIGGSSWSNAEAAAAISAAGYGLPVRLDRVTLYNAGAAYVETRYYDGASWVAFGTLINGNLLVTGSIGADKLVANLLSTDNVLTRGLTVRDSNGAVILSSGQPLSGNMVVPLGGWLNSNISISSSGALSGAGGGQVTIGGLGYTGALDATRNNQPWRSTSPPSSPVTGDIWVDISVNPHVVRVWAAGAWRLSSTVGASFTVGAEGQISGQITNSNVSTWIANAAIGNAQIATASIGLAKIDLATITNLAALNAFTGQLTVDATGHIKGGATSYSLGDGFWIGNDGGTYKFRIGSAAQYMRWTGSGLEIKLAPLDVSSPSSISVVRGNGDQLYGTRVVTPSGGTPPYTYTWTVGSYTNDAAGAGSVYVSAGVNSETVTIRGRAVNSTNTARAICTVTDANGRVGMASFAVSCIHDGGF